MFLRISAQKVAEMLYMTMYFWVFFHLLATVGAQSKLETTTLKQGTHQKPAPHTSKSPTHTP